MKNICYQAWLASREHGITFSVEGNSFAAEECRRFLQPGADCRISFATTPALSAEAFHIKGSSDAIVVEGGCETGLLYGAYELIRCLNQGQKPYEINCQSTPAVSARVLNHWDNGDGSVERGYSGNSLFWKNGKLGYDLPRLTDYARLLASVGINQVSVNNVNVRLQTAKLLTDEGLADLVRVAEVFRPFGIRLIVAVHFDSPVWLGGLETSDPVAPKVAEFWQAAVARVYAKVPDLAGFLVKADSEFNLGPLAFGHTQDVGANVIARALQPFGGVLYWRCFVYNCLQDWRDTVTDRPKAAYDTFFPIDGKFDSNVILQIKHGPSDFQVREPNSPLLGAMAHTRQAIEFQIAQEYTGQQKDLYATAVQWQEILEQPFDESSSTRDLISNKIEAIVAVSNTGDDENWCGNYLAQANLYAFGRMAWNPALTAEEVIREWVALSFSNPTVHEPITKMLLASRATYEKYNAPLGIGWMVNINHHYGPSVDGYEYMKWGTYHRADAKAIGVDRTTRGTGYTAQYTPYLRDLYDDIETCPEEMLLFFHRLPYDYVLQCGRTLLQYIYDTHFEGVEDVEEFIKTWNELESFIPREIHSHVAERFAMQLENAMEWRDVVNSYFYRKTGIADLRGRTIH